MTYVDPIQTTCPYCGVGCGLLVRPDGEGAPGVQGDPAHPSNQGRICSKGANLGQTVDLRGRLLHPEIQGRPTDWDAAAGYVAERMRAVLAESGPGAIGFLGSGQMLTEDYYVANKLFKGFIGTPHVDTNSRLCMASAVAGHARGFGEDVVPASYEDLEVADLVVLVGSNTAWCHPVIYQRIRDAREAHPGKRLVVIDPRRTETCDMADLHLPIAPGTDVWLWNALLRHLAHDGHTDFAFLQRSVEGFGDALEAAEGASTIPEIANQCDLPEEDVARFFRWFGQTERTVTLFSQGVHQSSAGTDKVSAILNAHLLTGRIGRPGAGPLSITGQPNAMGGREVGGLANQLAAHMGYTPEAMDRVARFWDAPGLAEGPGYKAVDLLDAVGRGEIRVLWIMGTNPVVSMPDADRVREALRACELVIVSDVIAETDTTVLADVCLPALAWGEKDGTVTNAERRISRQRAFLPAPGEARADWWALARVGRELGFRAAFDYADSHAIFDEHTRLSTFENDGDRVFDLGHLTGLTRAQYDALAPTQWPAAQPFHGGVFPTPSGRAAMVPLAPRAPVHAPGPAYPLALNTGRVRSHWHTLTRTGKSPRLALNDPEPTLDLHPDDVDRLGLVPEQLGRVRSVWGEAIGRVRVDEGVRAGTVFMPMHWNDQYAVQGRVNAVVNPVVDPVSGEPEFKHTPVAVERVEVRWHGFLMVREPPQTPPACRWWARAGGEGFVRYEIAGTRPVEEALPDLLALLGTQGEQVEMQDPARGHGRFARLDGHRLLGCLFVSTQQPLPARFWLEQLFQREALSSLERASLLAGQPLAGPATAPQPPRMEVSPS